MRRQQYPLLRLDRRNGHVERLLVGPCAVRLFLGLATIVAFAVLLSRGVIQVADISTIGLALRWVFGPW